MQNGNVGTLNRKDLTMFLEDAAELFPDPMDEDEIQDLLADPWLDDQDREALETLLDNI
jgi:hypothetical protein